MKDLSLKPIHIELPYAKESAQLVRRMSQLEADLRENFQRIQASINEIVAILTEMQEQEDDE